MEYVFAVCPSRELTLPAELVSRFDEAIERADVLTKEKGIAYSAIPLKTPEWRGICGNCGQPWTPAGFDISDVRIES
jgi:hypothetical protein